MHGLPSSLEWPVPRQAWLVRCSTISRLSWNYYEHYGHGYLVPGWAAIQDPGITSRTPPTVAFPTSSHNCTVPCRTARKHASLRSLNSAIIVCKNRQEERGVPLFLSRALDSKLPYRKTDSRPITRIYILHIHITHHI